MSTNDPINILQETVATLAQHHKACMDGALEKVNALWKCQTEKVNQLQEKLAKTTDLLNQKDKIHNETAKQKEILEGLKRGAENMLKSYSEEVTTLQLQLGLSRENYRKTEKRSVSYYTVMMKNQREIENLKKHNSELVRKNAELDAKIYEMQLPNRKRTLDSFGNENTGGVKQQRRF